MEQSMFIEWVRKWFAPLVAGYMETVNDTKKPQTYLYKRLLRREYSVTGTYESLSLFNHLVAADIVAMDSPLPLKDRPAGETQSGEIVKIGMKLQLNEKQMTDLDILVAQSSTKSTAEQQLVAKLFADLPRVISGVYERLEAIFLESFSSGLCVVPDSETTGTGIRIDYQISATHQFGVEALWSDHVNSTPIDDIQAVLDQADADGNSITKMWLDPTALKNLRESAQVKERFAWSINYIGQTQVAPNNEQLSALLGATFDGITFEVVNRSVVLQKNKTRTTVKPWKTGSVVFTNGEDLGMLVWATLAEMNHPVSGVEYQTADEFILVSKYRKNEPLAEFITSQARALPVLTNTDQLYYLDSTTLEV